MKRSGAILLLILTPCLVFSGEKISKEFPMQKGQELSLNFRHIGGSLEIVGWQQNVVKVEGEMSGTDWDSDCKLEFDGSDRGLRIVPYCSFDDEWLKADLKVFVPEQFDLWIKAGMETKIKNVAGELELAVGNAHVAIDKFRGKVKFNSANGQVEITDSELDGDISNVNGRLVLKNTNVRGKVSTVNSAMELNTADSGIVVKCVNGAIKIDSARDYVEANTTNASVEISELDGSLRVETLNGGVLVNMVGDPESGDHDIDLETMNGDIELFLPENFSMAVDIEIRKDYEGRNRKQFREKYEIVSDFDIQTEEKMRGRDVEMHGSGTVGSGRNKVRIRAVNGDVHLKRRS